MKTYEINNDFFNKSNPQVVKKVVSVEDFMARVEVESVYLEYSNHLTPEAAHNKAVQVIGQKYKVKS